MSLLRSQGTQGLTGNGVIRCLSFRQQLNARAASAPGPEGCLPSRGPRPSPADRTPRPCSRTQRPASLQEDGCFPSPADTPGRGSVRLTAAPCSDVPRTEPTPLTVRLLTATKRNSPAQLRLLRPPPPPPPRLGPARSVWPPALWQMATGWPPDPLPGHTEVGEPDSEAAFGKTITASATEMSLQV